MAEMIMNNTKYIAILLGLLAGYPLMWQRRKKVGLEESWQVFILCVFFTAASVLSALLFASFEKMITGRPFSFGAISIYGIYFFCPLMLLAAARGKRDRIRNGFDLYALYAMPSLFFLRINCMISGCCGGIPISGTGLHWPTRQAEMVFYAAMLIVLIRREKQGASPGHGFPLLMASYGCFRFIVEWFRISEGTSPLHLAHLWSVLAAALGFAIFFELKKRDVTAAVHKGRMRV